MKNAILLAMVTQSRQPQVLYNGEVYRLTDEGSKIKRVISIFKTVLLVLFILFYSFMGQYYAADILGDSIFVTIIVVLIAYIAVIGISYLFGLILLRNVTNIEALVTRVE